MIGLAVTFVVIAIIAAILKFDGIAGPTAHTRRQLCES